MWDGSFTGEALLPGVFVYTLKVRYMINGIEKDKIFVGDVTLVK